MIRFILTRSIQAVSVLAIVSVVAFAVLHLAPGGPLSQFTFVPGMGANELAELAREYGLDRPLPVQYWDWITNLLVGDWGKSYRDGQPVLSVIGSHLWPTLMLMGSAIVLAIIMGTALGVLASTRPYSALDNIIATGAMIALSVPTFWLGLITIYVFAVKLDWIPAGNMYTVGARSVWNTLHHLIAPCFTLAFVSMATWSRYIRSSYIDVLGQDYIRTARAKGLRGRRIYFRHALRNAMLPMITLVGLEFPMLLGGAVVTETVFAWPGMGRLFLDSLSYRDYPMIMGIFMLSAVMVLIGSILADILYAVSDPRIRKTR